VCNLYSMTTNREAMRKLLRVEGGWNQLHLPAIFPDKPAPIIRRTATGERETVAARWGMPRPPAFLKPEAIDRGVTNIRNVNSPHWRAWMRPENRCLVPVTSFCEPTDAVDPVTGKKVWTWFAMSEERPLFAFAGIWCRWQGMRGTQKAPEQGEHLLYGFLTTAANGVVAPIHAKAMPVILRTAEECDAWLTAGAAEALHMQRPAPDDALKIVTTGEKEDPPPASAPSDGKAVTAQELPL
jgi:putative SOS response-associated peptidase YedK